MLAKLFGFTRAFQWSLVIGFVTVGSWVTAQHIEPGDVPPPIEESVEASARSAHFEYEPPATPGRDSLFVIESEAMPTAPIVNAGTAEMPIDLVANETAADTTSELHVAPPQLAVYDEPQACATADALATCTDSLERAAQTGCRLFENLTSKTQSEVIQVSDTAELETEPPVTKPAAVEVDSRLDLVATAPEVLPAAEWPVATQAPPPHNPCRACRNEQTSSSAAVEQPESKERQAPPMATPVRPQTCRLKNRRTNEPMATLEISSASTSQLTPEELELAQQDQHRGIHPGDVNPRLEVSQNEYTQAWQIDARNIELPQLLEQLSHYCAFPIVCGQDVTGTVSANVSAHSMDELLYRLVKPFGFKISREGATLVVGTPYPAADIYADYNHAKPLANQPEPLPTSTAGQPPVPLAQVDDRLSEKVDRLPPVGPEATKVEPVSLNRKTNQVIIDDVDLRVAEYAKFTISKGNTPEAIAMIRQAIVERPQSAFLHRILGEAYAFQSDYDRSATALAQSIKLNKFDPLTSQVFSEVLTQLGQERRAQHYAQLSKDVASGLVTAN
jgi:tetratricopeptide (TPR) repeat protein